MDSLLELRFNGLSYAYWKKVDIRKSVDDLCASVQLSITLPPEQSKAFSPDKNTVATVFMNGVLIATVRLDIHRRRVDPVNHSISLVARSLARELVDCQYSKTLSGLKLGEIVKRLCALFKVPVNLAAETAVVPQFSMQSEIPANALLNAVRASNLLLYPLPSGGLILTEPTNQAPVATLIYGQHILSYEVVDEYKLIYSEYLVKSFDYDNGAAQKGAVKDPSFNFFRPLHIIADRHGYTLGGLQRRATLERNRREARAKRIELVVQGWGFEDNGQFVPWDINTQVRVIIPSEGIDNIYLLADLSFSQDDTSGTTTNMTLTDRNAFIGERAKSKKVKPSPKVLTLDP